MLGEVGLDRVFRIPLDYYASPRHRTDFTVPIAHQLAVLHSDRFPVKGTGRETATLAWLSKTK